MNEHPPGTATMTAHSRRRHPSFIWILPLVALAIGLWLVVQGIVNKGPIVTISFSSAEGLEAGKTKIRYKDIDIGSVTSLELSADRKTVIVTAELRKSVTDILVSDSRFFVVKPRISGGSVSGLGTLLSGAYIGVDAGSSQVRARAFRGLETPPLITSDSSGREFVLHGDQLGSLDVGSPVYFRRIKVGHVTQYALDPGGAGVTLRVFVDSPADVYVTETTRFWQASGIDMALDANGFRVSTQSFAAMLEGGLAFEDKPATGALPRRAAAETRFTLFTDREQAMRPADTDVRTYLMYFNESLRGLSPGAPVDLRGIVIGEVKSLDVEYGEDGRSLRFPVEITIFPSRLRSRMRANHPAPTLDDAAERRLIDHLFASGMRAQLKTGNLLTGQLFVALDYFSGAKPASVDWNESPPVMPTVNGSLSELQDSVGRIVKKIDQLPLEKMSGQLVVALDSLNKTLEGTQGLVRHLDGDVLPEAAHTMQEARAAASKAKEVLDSDSAVQQDLDDALRQVGKAARSLATLTDMLERHPDSLIFGNKDGRK